MASYVALDRPGVATALRGRFYPPPRPLLVGVGGARRRGWVSCVLREGKGCGCGSGGVEGVDREVSV